MFDELDHCQPAYSATSFDPSPPVSFDPFELTFDQPTFEPEIYQPPEDPMAYALPAVVDAYAFDHSAPNAIVGYAMNEIARSLKLSEDTLSELSGYVSYAAGLCSKYSLPVIVSYGFPFVREADVDVLITDAEDRREYWHCWSMYQCETGFRF